MAAEKLMASRISPIMMMSGSWRRMCLRPCSKERVSRPISRCSMTDWLSSNTNSIGSSSVMMCFLKLALMCSIMAASVVDLPQPVGPDTNTIPRGDSAICFRISSNPSSSKLGILIFT